MKKVMSGIFAITLVAGLTSCSDDTMNEIEGATDGSGMPALTMPISEGADKGFDDGHLMQSSSQSTVNDYDWEGDEPLR